MTLADIAQHEWKTRLSTRTAIASLLLFAAALLYGAASGRIERDARVAAIAKHEAAVSSAMARWHADLKALEEKGARSGVPPWAASAMDVTFSSSLPPAPLGDFAIGQSDLLPYSGSISLWDPDIRLFSRYEFEDPVSLALGTFDLSKAIILILPVVLIVLSYDVLSADRDAKRLGLMVAQGANIRSLFWSRLAIRSTAAVAVLFLIAVLALSLPDGQTPFARRLPSFTLWTVAALLYSAFWIALIAFVTSWNRRGESSVILLLVAWAAFTLVLPACSAALAEAAWPAPSRLAYLSEARETEIETERSEPELARRFVNDHPNLVIDDASAMPAYVRTAFLATTAVDDATRPILDRFEEAASRRENVLLAMRYVSPAIIAHGFFNDIAGTSSARHRRYMAEARWLKAKYARLAGLSIVAGRRLPMDLAASLPQFQFTDEPLRTTVWRHTSALIFSGLTAALLLFLADLRLRRAGVHG